MLSSMPEISHSLLSSCFSADIVVNALGKRVPAASQERPVPKVNNSNINKRTISHFLILGRGKSCCQIFCFSMKGSCAPAHTVAHELVVPIK